ncbi:MAG: hypothetical protein HY321_22890 [Armatimonadetes bacterium]|nr:hypothetical protein [Armatimonadota bacterium]
MSTLKEKLHAVVESLTDEEAGRLFEMARELRVADEQAALLDALRAIPGVTVPERWPPRFHEVEPVVVVGKPASEMLIEDRQ